MNTLDLSPFYRSSIGFDQLASMLDSTLRNENAGSGYPPYNIEVIDDNKYEITLAVSGFSENELDIQVENKALTVRGSKAEDNVERNYLHKGIAARAFERKFNLADYVEITGANLKDGLLTISLVKEIPEVMKPKRIDINAPGNILDNQSEEKASDAEDKQAA